MNKQKVLTGVLTLILIYLFQLSVNAQSDDSNDVISDKVLIINGSGTSVKFLLRNENSDWTWFSLDAGERGQYKNAAWIRIWTEGGYIEDRVEHGNRYEIYQETRTGIWTYRRIFPRRGR